MSNPDNRDGSDNALRPRVVVMEAPRFRRIAEPSAPRIIATEQTGRIVTAPPAEPQPAAP